MSDWPFDPAAVAAGAVDDEDHAAIAAALRTDPAFAAEVAGYQRLVDQLESLPGVAWEPVQPPLLDLAAITRDAPKLPMATSHRPSPWRRRGLLAAAALLLVVAVGVVVRLATGDDGGPAQRTIQLAPLEGEPADVVATVTLPTTSTDTVRVRISGATPTPDGYVEELWLMNSGTDLVSLGTFRVGPDGTADATFTTAADIAAFDYVDASREPSDGNPAHSGDSILRSAPLR